MKPISMIGAVLVAAIALSVPEIAWSHVSPNPSNNPEITDTAMPNHHGGGHHGSGGRHGGCW